MASGEIEELNEIKGRLPNQKGGPGKETRCQYYARSDGCGLKVVGEVTGGLYEERDTIVTFQKDQHSIINLWFEEKRRNEPINPHMKNGKRFSKKKITLVGPQGGGKSRESLSTQGEKDKCL